MSVQAITCAMALRGVSPSEKLLLLALANYADERMQCWPSQRRLAEDTCLTDRTVRALLTELEDRGFLSRERRERDDGSRATDRITLHFHGIVPASSDAQISGGAEIISGGVRKQLPGGAEMVSGLTTFEPSIETPTEPQRAAEPPGFAEWWEAYPRKTAKGAARSAYRSALKKAKPEVLLASLAAARFSQEAKFIPHPATWLNQERWLDEPAGGSHPTTPPPPADPWPRRMLNWRTNGYWNSEWGPKPGRDGCLAPPELLQDQAA